MTHILTDKCSEVREQWTWKNVSTFWWNCILSAGSETVASSVMSVSVWLLD